MSPLPFFLFLWNRFIARYYCCSYWAAVNKGWSQYLHRVCRPRYDLRIPITISVSMQNESPSVVLSFSVIQGGNRYLSVVWKPIADVQPLFSRNILLHPMRKTVLSLPTTVMVLFPVPIANGLRCRPMAQTAPWCWRFMDGMHRMIDRYYCLMRVRC